MQTAHTRYQSLLAASVTVHRLLLTQQDLPTLLQGICDQMVREELHRTAWMVLLDSEVGSVITAETGLGERFNVIMGQLRNSELPECGKRCLEQQKNAAIYCRHCSCGACTDADGQCGAVAVAIRCRAGLFGFLVVELPSPGEIDQAELQLLQEMADSISQALRRLFAVEESRQREHELKQVEERFELALSASQAGLWDWNIKTGDMYTSHDRKDFLDYREENGRQGISSLQRFIHPDDQEEVLQVLNDHLAGKTDEYRIEYRIRDQDGTWQWFLDRGRVVERDEKNMPVRMTGTHQNITRQKKQDEALAAVQQQLHEAVDTERSFLQTVIDGAADPVMAIDTDYNVLLMNKVATKLLHVDPEVVRRGEQKCYQLFAGRDHPCDHKQYLCPVQQVMKNGRPVTLVHNPYHGNGINNTFEIEVSPLRDTEGEMYGTIEVARDITDRLRIEQELRESRSRLYRLAHHDSLTGLPNRAYFDLRIVDILNVARTSDQQVAILFIDLDRFKVINDTLGHSVGDEMLVELAGRMQKIFDKNVLFARMGGDEFVVTCILEDGKKEVEEMAGKLLSVIREPVHVYDYYLNTTASIGIALFPDDGMDKYELVKYADSAMYAAKEKGKDNYQFYTKQLSLDVQTRLNLEQELLHALERKELHVEYQPQYLLETGEVKGAEALLRWDSGILGKVSPDDFIAIAEETGVIVKIGYFVFEEACKAYKKWRDEGFLLERVAINISAVQFREEYFLEKLKDILVRTGVEASAIEIEITERFIMEYSTTNLTILEDLRTLGCQISIDDFGTGYSSMSYMKQLPLDTVKIDKSFIVELPGNAHDAEVSKAIIALSKSLGYKVVAEGIENAAQEQFLRENKCDFAQGFYFAEPMDEKQFLDFLKEKGIKNPSHS